MKHARVGGLAVWAAAVALVAAGCSKEAAAPSAAASGAAPASGAASGAGGPISVSSVRAVARDVDVMLEATGTISALNSVEIRPQVSSVITQVNIREGQFVKAGQLLFTLDARTDEVNLAKARTQLARDQASLADAQRQLKRSRELLEQNFISQGAVDTTQTLVATQQAVVAADQAAIRAAQVSVSYYRIVAPAAGRAGAINVFVGSTVQPAGAALVTITQLDPIAVAFSLPQRNLADALAALRTGGGEVTVQLPEAGATLKGRLQFVDSAVDAASGNVRVKAQFDNKEQKLWPGAYLNVRMVVRTIKDAIVVPQAAVIQSPKGKQLYVLENGHAAARQVELVYASGVDAVVTGVAAGDQVIVDGRQNLRPGVAAVERSASGAGRGEGKSAGERASDAPTGTVAAGAAGASAGTP
jgi:RND family efflux transporter MFP subunit